MMSIVLFFKTIRFLVEFTTMTGAPTLRFRLVRLRQKIRFSNGSIRYLHTVFDCWQRYIYITLFCFVVMTVGTRLSKYALLVQYSITLKLNILRDTYDNRPSHVVYQWLLATCIRIIPVWSIVLRYIIIVIM